MLHFMLLVRSFNHLSIGAMYEQGPMIFVCREITLTASCFDGKRQLLDSLRSKFPGGTIIFHLLSLLLSFMVEELYIFEAGCSFNTKEIVWFLKRVWHGLHHIMIYEFTPH